MKQYILLIAFVGLAVTSLAPDVMSQGSGESDISVSVDRVCDANTYEFRFAASNISQNGVPMIGTGGTGYFVYGPTNQGEMAYIQENIEIYKVNVSTADIIKDMNVSSPPQPEPYKESYLLDSQNLDGDFNISRLLSGDERAINMSYWYHENYTGWPQYPDRIKTKEFVAGGGDSEGSNTSTNSTNSTDTSDPASKYTAGFYRADLQLNNTCEFTGDEGSKVYNASSGTSISLGDLNSTIQGAQALNLSVDGINSSILDHDSNYIQSKEFSDIFTTYFRIVDVEGNGSTPTEVSDINQEIGRNLDTDADQVSNFTKNASLNRSEQKKENTSLNTNRNVSSNLTRNSSLDSDAEQTSDATEVEGNNPDQPGETEVPEPEPEPVPEPDPVPLLSVDMKPQETVYTTPRGRFQEIGLNVTNTGEETINNLRLEPRFSEGMDWEAQGLNIGSLDVGASTNASVYVNAGEEVDPGMYQIPVYASNDENDIGNQYVNVEVTEQIFTSALTISEAPQDIRFEMSRNYTVPVLLENDGDTALENVEVELQNAENCGEYTSEVVDEIPAGESAAINIEFRTSEALEECQATLIASTDSGEFAFSDMNIQNIEEEGIVPQEFRFPIVASMWTLMLLAYAVLTKRYGLHNLTVKVPLVLLVIGEALILIYLSSVYYNLMPPGLLPF